MPKPYTTSLGRVVSPGPDRRGLRRRPGIDRRLFPSQTGQIAVRKVTRSAGPSSTARLHRRCSRPAVQQPSPGSPGLETGKYAELHGANHHQKEHEGDQ